jgi:hypothetical protein
MKQIEQVYTVKSIGPPDYYLGNDYKRTRRDDGASVARNI